MKEKFTSERFNRANTILLKNINDILEDYYNQGYRLSLRQIYYQLVSRDLISNNDKEYTKIMHIVRKGRLNGDIDWSFVEDRIRSARIHYYVEDIEDALNDTVKTYRLDLMRNQDKFIEVWIEKDALSNIIYRTTQRYSIPLMVNRGYSSISAMYDASKRLSQNGYIIYLGDHDPSGLDMIRDIEDRLSIFECYPQIIPIALNMEQIRKYNLPPNPAKITDPRSKDYIKKYGNISWELDALSPNVLTGILDSKINELIDIESFNTMIQKEYSDKQKLSDIISNLENE